MAKAVVRSKAMVLLLLVYFLCTPIVFWSFVLVCITSSPFLSCNHLDEEEIAGCFAFIVFRVSCYYKYSVGLPHAIVGMSAVCDCGIFRIRLDVLLGLI